MSGWMIDWVSISQQHQASDIVGKNVCIWLDPVTGERISEGVGYLSHEGSFSTSVSIRAYNGFVEWSGNPSRWGRADNVFGYRRMADCLQVINAHLLDYGLPPFTMAVGPDFNHRRLAVERQGVRLANAGAVFTRVDLCRNFSTGSESNLRTYLRAASAAVYRGKPAQSYSGGCSWGTARNSKITFYDKGAEILSHMPSYPDRGLQTSLDPLAFELSDEVEYRKRLANWCTKIGLCRKEIKLGRQQLRAQGLRSLAEWDDHRAFEIADKRISAMNIGVSSGLDNAFKQFVESGFTDRQAATLSGIVSRWYMGEPTDLGVSRATWYRYAKNIKAVLGLDLNAKPDVAVLTAQVRTIELQPISEPPFWYRHAA